MRVLVSSQPGLGHLNAIIAFSLALRNAGHEVLVAGAPSVVAGFSRAGVQGEIVVDEPLRSDAAQTHAEVPELRLTPGPERLAKTREHVAIRMRALPLLERLLPVVQSWSPDVILRDETELAAWVVAERSCLPDVSFEVSTHWPRSRWNSELAGPLAALRAAAGLSASDGGPADTLYRDLHISNAPPSFRDEARALPDTTVELAPDFFEAHGEPVALPTQLKGHAYVAFGSVYDAPRQVVREVVDVLATRLGAVVAAGFEPRQGSVTSATYIPQTPAMAGCSVVVCHGGRNTVLTAMRHGVPVVCVPIASDHFDVAEFVMRSGAGTTARWEAGEIAKAALHVATEERFRRAARNVAEEIDAMPGPGLAIARMVELVERYRRDAPS